MTNEEKNDEKVETKEASPYEGEPETQIQVVRMGKERKDKK